MIDEQGQDGGLTDDEELLVAALPEELIARIDAAILAKTSNVSWHLSRKRM